MDTAAAKERAEKELAMLSLPMTEAPPNLRRQPEPEVQSLKDVILLVEALVEARQYRQEAEYERDQALLDADKALQERWRKRHDATLRQLAEAQGKLRGVREAWDFIETAIVDSDVHQRHAYGDCDSCDAVWDMVIVVRDCILRGSKEGDE